MSERDIFMARNHPFAARWSSLAGVVVMPMSALPSDETPAKPPEESEVVDEDEDLPGQVDDDQEDDQNEDKKRPPEPGDLSHIIL